MTVISWILKTNSWADWDKINILASEQRTVSVNPGSDAKLDDVRESLIGKILYEAYRYMPLQKFEQ